MFTTYEAAKKYILEHDVEFVDFKMIDLAGRWHHLTIPAGRFSQEIFEDGIGFDGSSYGFLTVEKSDMIFMPDVTTSFVDPFQDRKTLVMLANIYALEDGHERFAGDPRFIAEKAEAFLASSGIATEARLGPEFEYYIFDQVSFDSRMQSFGVEIDADHAHWNQRKKENNLGYKVAKHKGYHVDLPYDVTVNLRNDMVALLEKHDVPVKYHHPEVGGPGQMEIEVNFGNVLTMGDRTMKLKYMVKNLALKNGKTVTFMPKPLYGEAGSGMHVHMHFFKDGQPIFYDEQGYSGLSQTALYAIGGILEHAGSLMAFTNPSTNSYKRLVPGYEAPVSICFGTSNRSAVIRIPGYAKKPKDKRFEFRSSDATCNPYLAYSALIMAAIDGIVNKIDPSERGFGPLDVNIFTLSDEEKRKIKGLPKSLEEAAQALEEDHDYLLAGGVFTKGLIKDQLKALEKQVSITQGVPTPKEFELYYDL